MKNSVSDQSFTFIESDDEDVEKASNQEEEDGNFSDSSSHSSLGNRQQSKPNSYTTSWPQSYR